MKVLIDNGTNYPLTDVLKYLSGYTTKLNGKIETNKFNGSYYDTIVVKPSK